MTNIEIGKTYESESNTFRDAWNNGRVAAEQAHTAVNTMVRILKQDYEDWSIRKVLHKIADDHKDLEGFSLPNLYKYLDDENRTLLQDNSVSNEKPKNDKKEPPPEENVLETENQFLKEQLQEEKTRREELEDALKKTEQFKPATQLQTAKDPNPTPELQLTDDLVFQYLRDRAKETGNILIIDRVGAGALVQALAQYKNSFGVAELFLRVIK